MPVIPDSITLSSPIPRRRFLAGTVATMGSLLLQQDGSELQAASPAHAKNKKGLVPTMTGPIASAHLGTTLMHEHLLFGEIPEDLRADSVEFAVKLLADAARVGVDTLVCLTPFREIKLYQEIAARTPMKIIASTGFYLRKRVPAWMQAIDDEKKIEELMLRDLIEGVGGTRIKAGIIKVAANGLPIDDWEKKVYRAAARAQQATRAPIGTHAVSGAREQFELLVSAGANPNRLFFSHPETVGGWRGRNRGEVLGEFLSIAKEGGSLLFNNFGQEYYTPWNDMVFLMRELCERGFSSRLLISVDCNWEWKQRKIVFEAEDGPYFDPNASKRTYAYMMTDVVPAMLKAGFSKKELDTFMIENPRRLFS